MIVTVTFADVAELADALDLGSSSSRSEGSSPFIRIKTKNLLSPVFYWLSADSLFDY